MISYDELQKDEKKKKVRLKNIYKNPKILKVKFSSIAKKGNP